MKGVKGSRKFQCEECKAIRFVHWAERNRAARPKCMKCGSTRLEPASEGAKDDITKPVIGGRSDIVMGNRN
jgi:transposase-like protein